MSETNHLKHISIMGFKSIKSLDLKMSSINILIGANGAGKTNFISMFTFLQQLSEGKLKKHVEKGGFANSFFHFSAKKTPVMQIEIEVGNNGYHASIEHGSSDDMLVFKKEFCTINSSKKDFVIEGVRGESGLVPGSVTDSYWVQKYTRDYLQDCRVYHFHDTSNTASFKQAKSLDDSDYLYADAGNLAPFLYRLKNSNDQQFEQSYFDIVQAIKTVTPFFHDFYLETRGDSTEKKIILKWLHRDHDEPFSANQLSDGTARFMCMATLFLQPEALRPNTIILDEPELGLHPAALDVLSDLVKASSIIGQVICSTQSVTFANNFSPEDFIVVDQKDGASNFSRLKDETMAHWLTEFGMGDIWSKNLIGGRPEW